MSIERAQSRGHNAGMRGEPFGSNPYQQDQPAERAAWANGHNNGRVQMIFFRESLREAA